jgi:mono/diheme cytochrome c family protein
VLGGSVTRPPSDGSLVTSIIYQSYQLARYPASEVVAGGRSRMPNYADRITAQQLTDIVEFLQAHYKVERTTPTFPYY